MAAVLVVDDDHLVRHVLSEALTRAGYTTTTAEHGAEALATLATDPLPDVILLDLIMPVMDGLEFLIRRSLDPRVLAVPVVVITAHIDHRVIRAHAELLARIPVLTKPVEMETLLWTLKSAQGETDAG